MSELLDQAREAWQRTIDENSESITFHRKAQVSDGFDGTVDNPFGAETAIIEKVRLSHDAAIADGAGPGGIAEHLNRYLMLSHKSTIARNDVFDAIGKKWRVLSVDKIVKFHGIIGFRAPVIEAVSMEANT
jgi:hypothetical protein